jgi:hypothetical protein
MIYCVWYPSGGFGHFINAILSLHGKNFVRPKKQLMFSNNGNSHDLDLVVPKFLHGTWTETFEFADKKNYSVLIDNGINDESEQFKSVFPDASVIKICYTDYTWPIVARTMIDKAMNSSLDDELPVDIWNTLDLWARREKYFLFLRDHSLRFAWKPNSIDFTLKIDNMLEYADLSTALESCGIELDSFDNIWKQWQVVNQKYITPMQDAKIIIDCVKNNISFDLGHIVDVWNQAVIYYYIWLEFGIEVPHNDYANWFANTQDIVIMLNKHGVLVDTN